MTIHGDRVEYQNHGFDKRTANEAIALKHASSLSVANDAIGTLPCSCGPGRPTSRSALGREGANRMHDRVIAVLPR